MTAEEKLTILKSDLQLLTNTQDTYLAHLLEASEAAVNAMGITDDGTVLYDDCVIKYAAWVYRKRAASTSGSGGFMPDGGETAIPRFLGRQLNALLFKQKAGAS